MAADTKRIVGGVGLLVVSSAVLLGAGMTSGIPVPLVVLAAFGMAAGALLLGTSEGGRPV
jgi:hypothetical protein